MISHRHKVIFIHIPKCAGSSFEKLLGARPFDWRKPDYEKLVGWCPRRQIHLQHATAKQLLETELIDEGTWGSYFKFAFVRNPWDRAMSDYFWMRGQTGIRDSFQNFIQREGSFSRILTDHADSSYRGDHLDPQWSFITINNQIAVDFIGKFEALQEDYGRLGKLVPSLNGLALPHEQRLKKRFGHYAEFYTRRSDRLVRLTYERDIAQFGYEFEKIRSIPPGIRQVKTRLLALYYQSAPLQSATSWYANLW